MESHYVYPDKALLIVDFLTADECDALVKQSEEQGYASASLASEGVQAPTSNSSQTKDVRNHDRVVLTDQAKLTGEWFKKAKDLLPQVDKLDGSVVSGLDDKIRFYRYDKDQKFSKHYDGYTYGSVTYSSKSTGAAAPMPKWSFLIYLNDASEFEGGRTRFFGVDGSVEFEVTPKKGQALIYQHQLLHEGEKLKSGRKYVVRTDVLYVKKSASNSDSGCIVQ